MLFANNFEKGMIMLNQDLTRIYAEFTPEPLSEKKDNLYINLDAIRGDMKGLSLMSKRIAAEPSKPTCQLLAGHRGSGKSTELRRLRQDLEKQGFFAIYFDIEDGTDIGDVDFTDILFLVIQQLAEQTKKHLKITLTPSYFKQRLDEIKDVLFSEVGFENMELGAAFAKINATLKDSPTSRKKIRQLLEPKTNDWLFAANKIIEQAHFEANKEKKKGIVIIVDGLDKLSTAKCAEDSNSISERLFIDRYAQMTALKCHMVYAMPLALAYSCRERSISSLYGISAPPVVPMNKLYDDKGKKNNKGFELFREIVAARLKEAKVSDASVFEAGVLEHIIELSGGQPRELMIIIQGALLQAETLPINKDAVKNVIRPITHAYARQLRDEHWEIISKIIKNPKTLPRNEKNDALCMDLLDSRAVLQYCNDSEWYKPNPLLPQLPVKSKKTKK